MGADPQDPRARRKASVRCGSPHQPTGLGHRLGSLVLLPILLLAASTSFAAAQQVHILLSGQEDLYRDLANSLESRLRADAQARQLRLTRSQADDYDADAVDLSVAVGMKACETVLASSEPHPSLCVLVPRAGFSRLTARYGRRPLSAIYLDQPIARQFTLARAILPEARRAGILAGPELRAEAGDIRRSARGAGFEAYLEPTDDAGDVARGIQRLLTRSDLVLAVYEPDVLTPSNAKWLLHLAYKKRLPVMGFSRAYVKAGAVAAVFSTPEQIGRQTAEAILAWARNGGGDLGPAAYPRYFDVAVNRAVADSLGLRVPSDESLSKRVAQMSVATP